MDIVITPHDLQAAAGGTLYQRLANAIAARIAQGDFPVGHRLPGQRELSQALTLNITTITRAFRQLQAQGLIESRPGRGSIVVQQAPVLAVQAFQSSPLENDGVIDLTLNRASDASYLEALGRLLPTLSQDPRFAALQDYQAPEGPLWARQAIAQSLAAHLGPVAPDEVVLTHGLQHALDCVLSAQAHAGDALFVDALGYQGINALSRSHGLALHGIAQDADGMLPAALEAQCQPGRSGILFVVPTYHNPTTITMPLARRQALVAVARRHDLLIIEDGAYDPLAGDTPPTLRALAPERTLYLGSYSKCIAPGLRLGYAIGPGDTARHIATAMKVNCWSGNPMSALIVTRFIEDGTLQGVIRQQQAELRTRIQTVRSVLGAHGVRAVGTCPHVWLPLPAPWRASTFVSTLRRHDISVLPSDAFATGQEPSSHAIRINVAAARSHAALESALDTIRRLLHAPDQLPMDAP